VEGVLFRSGPSGRRSSAWQPPTDGGRVLLTIYAPLTTWMTVSVA
jgi:hypothetical protein